MPELDRLKEDVAYLKFWQGLAVVVLVSIAGWLISNGAGADAWTFHAGNRGSSMAGHSCHGLGPADRKTNQGDRKAVTMELLATLVAFAIVIFIGAMALHVALRK